MRLSRDHIAGFVVGEGCFYAESAPDPKYRLGWRVRPGFSVELHAGDRAILEALKENLGCGGLYSLDFGRYAGYAERDWAPHAKFRVTRLADLHEKVVPYFDGALFGRKAAAFDIFKELVSLLQARRQRTPEGLEVVRALAEELAGHNARGRASARSGGG